MNHLGLRLAWLAVQVAILLVPALALHVVVSRRGPAPGASVAALCLGLVVALSVAAFFPWIGRDNNAHVPADASSATVSASGAKAVVARRRGPGGAISPGSRTPGGRPGPGTRGAVARLGPVRTGCGRAGVAVPALGGNPGGGSAGGDRRRFAPADARPLGGSPVPPSREVGR